MPGPVSRSAARTQRHPGLDRRAAHRVLAARVRSRARARGLRRSRRSKTRWSAPRREVDQRPRGRGHRESRRASGRRGRRSHRTRYVTIPVMRPCVAPDDRHVHLAVGSGTRPQIARRRPVTEDRVAAEPQHAASSSAQRLERRRADGEHAGSWPVQRPAFDTARVALVRPNPAARNCARGGRARAVLPPLPDRPLPGPLHLQIVENLNGRSRILHELLRSPGRMRKIRRAATDFPRNAEGVEGAPHAPGWATRDARQPLVAPFFTMPVALLARGGTDPRARRYSHAASRAPQTAAAAASPAYSG